MNFLKKNSKLMIGIILGMILAGSISAYATYTYFANEVIYKKSDETQISVADALNELYINKKETSDDTKEITTNGEQTLDKYYNKLNVKVNTAIPKTLLWTNSSPNSSRETFNITLSSSLADFSHILIQWKVKTDATTIYEDIFKVQPYRINSSANSGVYGINCFNDQATLVVQRCIRYVNDTTLFSGNAVDSNNQFKPSYLIPISIYGLNLSY